MSNLEKAARQALDLCVRIRDGREVWGQHELRAVCETLRAALEQAEPVAWVGLTDKDRLDIYGQASTDEVDFYARAIEAALKEKNAKPVQAEPAVLEAARERGREIARSLNIEEPPDADVFFAQQAEPVQPEPLTWLLINKTGARPLIYGDAAAPQQAEPVADATITTATLACKKPVKQAEPVTVCCCGDPTILETWHRKDAPCFAPQMAEPVAMDKIKRTHTAMTLRDFQQNADHEYAGMPHRIYRQTSSDGCYLCACLAEIDRLKQQAEPVQAEPVAESHRRATTGASGQSMTQADSGNPSF